MSWTATQLFRRFVRPQITRRPIRKRPQFRPTIEFLEDRVTPSVDVLTNHNDQARSASQLNETQLTPQNVNPTNFGELFKYSVDGYVYAQPLYKSQLNINGTVHNVVFVATEHDSVFAFDADNPDPATGGGLLWQTSFINPDAGITTVPAPQDVISPDIVPEIGITGTPVIDPNTNTMFVVAKTKQVDPSNPTAPAHYVQTLYALDITSGAIVNGTVIGDTTIGGPDGGYTDRTNVSVPGTGAGSDGTTVRFNALREHQRPGLVLANGNVYVTWASHGDNGPYHGWLVGFNEQTLQVASVFNTSPDGGLAGIWQSGAAPAVDQFGNLFFSTGNGTFDAFNTPAPGPKALGPGGGGLGYGPDNPPGSTAGGIGNSLAVKFDLYPNTQDPSEGNNSTGVFTNGRSPSIRGPGLPPNVPDISINLNGTGIDLHSGHHFSATLTYNNTAHTLMETITDQDDPAHPTFTKTYDNVDLASFLGGNLGYVGFTGGTGGLTAVQNINSWSLSAGGTPVLNYANFNTPTNLTANGNAKFTGGNAQLTDGGQSEAGSVFYNTQVNVSNGFTTTFNFQLTNANADGFTFTIQNAPGHTAGRDYGETVLKIAPDGSTVVDFFTPFDWQALNNQDLDLGSGATMIFDEPGTPGHPQPWHLAVEAGKTGRVYLIDRDNMGKYTPGGPDAVLQTVTLGGPGVWGSPAFWNNQIYYGGTNEPIQALLVYYNTTLGKYQLLVEPDKTPNSYGFPGAQPTVSSNNFQNGIVWAADVSNYGARGPATLYAYDANDLAHELYASNQTGLRDQAGGSVKFVTPTVANGHVYLGAEYEVDVYGLFPNNGQAPNQMPQGLTATTLSDRSIELDWTNPDNNNATGIQVYRSDDGGITFHLVTTLPRDATTYVDTGLKPGTAYYYELRYVNQNGAGLFTPTVEAATLISAPVLQATDICVGAVKLSWTATGNGGYTVQRSDDNGQTFTQVSGLLPPNQTTFTDTGVSNGTHLYQVTAYNNNPDQQVNSQIVRVTVGPVVINHPFGNAFPPDNQGDLVLNGDAQYAENILRLLHATNGEASSAFTPQQVDVRNFTTTFEWRTHEGTDPRADGFTFTIQTDPRGATALGGGGGSLGYEGITNSAAVTFRFYPPYGPNGESGYSGLGTNGHLPGAGSETRTFTGDPLNAINLNSQHTFKATLSYNGTVLDETIVDESVTNPDGSHPTFHQTFTVNISNLVHGDTAYVGFTAATGGLNAIVDITSWQFNENDANLPPRAPSNLHVTAATGTSATLAWNCNNNYTATGYVLQRATSPNGPFTTVATINNPNTTTYTDTGLTAGQTYYYRVLAFDASNRQSNPSQTVVVNPFMGAAGLSHQDIGTPGDPSPAGNATFSNGVYSLTASGSDIWDTTDHFQYLYQPLVGDGSIVARLQSAPMTPDYWTKAGIMIRADLTAGSVNDFMLDTPNPGHQEPVMQWRDTANNGTGDTGNHNGSLVVPTPIWLRLDRSGNLFSGYWALDSNGSPGAWNLMGEHTTAMGSTVYVGLALTAHNNGQVASANFDNVTITLPPSGGPSVSSSTGDGSSDGTANPSSPALRVGQGGNSGSVGGPSTPAILSGVGTTVGGSLGNTEVGTGASAPSGPLSSGTPSRAGIIDALFGSTGYTGAGQSLSDSGTSLDAGSGGSQNTSALDDLFSQL